MSEHASVIPQTSTAQPPRIESTEELEELLTRPQAPLLEFIKTIRGPLMILGAGGKMGPTLAVLARRAAELARHKLEIIAVSRYSDSRARDWLENQGVTTLT